MTQLWRNFPNLLTALRLGAAPVIAVFLLHGDFVAALCVFAFAGLSDAADGFLAKHFKLESRFGAWLDPAADKLLMLMSFLALTRLGVIPLWLTVLVIARDVGIVCAIALARLWTLPLRIAPSLLGKACTAVQVSFIGFLLLMLALGIDLPRLVQAGWFIAAVVTLASWLSYGQLWLKAFAAARRRAI